MADTTSELTTNPEQTVETGSQEISGIDDNQTKAEIHNVNNTMAGSTVTEEVLELTTSSAENTIPSVVLHESSSTSEHELNPEIPQETEYQSFVGLNTMATGDTVSSVVLSETNKPDEIAYSQTSSQQDVENQHTVMSISDTMAPNTVTNVVLSESNKPDNGEMVFTVVAVDNTIGDIIQMNSGNIPKEVQLSLVQPSPTETNTTTLTSTNSGHLSDINQLALIAASMEGGTKDPETTQDETPVVHMQNPTRQRKQDSPAKSVKGRVICTICDQDFSDLPSMRRHRLIHSEEKPYQCEFCDKSFRRKDNLREHRNIHTQENMYKCERCGKTFPRKYTHKVHMSRFCGKAGPVTSENEAWSSSSDKIPSTKPSLVATKCSEPCHICFKTFRDASTLKRHLLTHSDERPFKCTECDKAFRRKDHLQEHVIVHKMVRPFRCQTCGKSFSRKNGLKTHMIRTTHLVGFDDIILTAPQPKGSDDVQVHVVEQVLVTDQLVETSTAVFPENTQQDTVEPTPTKDVSEISLQSENTETTPAQLEFSEAPVDSGEVAETTVVISEKPAEMTNPGNDGVPEEAISHDLDSDIEKNLPCPTCSATFQGKDELWKHFQEHLTENMFACKHCFEIFPTTEDLEEHQKNCVSDEEGDGPQINEDSSQVSADQTANTSIGENETPSDETSTPNPKKRKRSGTLERTDQTCTVCQKVFRDSTALKRHSLVHSGERPHSCSHCEKRFRRRDHLKAHEVAHHSGVTSHECKTCDAAFNTRYALTVHVKTCKNRPTSPKEPIPEEVKLMGTPESKQCPICHKVFKDPSTQRRHFRIHSDERPFQCDICSKSFRRKDNLKEHLLCHSDEKPFSCNHCGKSLSRRSSLTNHMNVCPARKAVDAVSSTVVGVASGAVQENPIIPEIQFTEAAVQDVCVSSDPQEISAAHLLATGLTSSVVTSSDMATLDVTSSEISSSEVAPMEEDIEHGLRDEDDGSGNAFPCDECGKIFRAKWSLKFHQRIHTGEKPYTCTTCNRQFRQGSHLKIHERTHSGERPYQCQICGRAFIDSSTMKRHERLHKDAADPNAVIDEQHDVITTQDDIITTQDDVMKNQEYVISNQVINETNDGNIVQQGVEVSIANEGSIQLLVTTANELANAAQPISTNVVPEINQSQTRLDESNLGHILRECIRNQAVEKIDTLEDWQRNHPNESVEQLIYIQTEEPSEAE